MSKPKLAVIGVGTFGRVHLEVMRQLTRQGVGRLVSFCDCDVERVARVEQEFGVPGCTDVATMFDRHQPDVVTVVTPDHTHLDIVLAALDRGAHVLCEKPLDTTMDGCRKMIDAAETKGRLLGVDFHKRYDPFHVDARQKVKARQIGKVEYVYAHMEDRIEVPRDWLESWAASSSPTWFLGVHMYDLVRWLVGADAVKVYATGTKSKLASMGVDTFDSVQAKIDFADGTAAVVDASWILPDGFAAIVNQGIRLVGTDGILEVDSQDRGYEFATTDATHATGNPAFLLRSERRGCEMLSGYGYDSIADFVENAAYVLAGGRISDIAGSFPDGSDGLEATRIAVAAHRSIETGAPVDATTL